MGENLEYAAKARTDPRTKVKCESMVDSENGPPESERGSRMASQTEVGLVQLGVLHLTALPSAPSEIPSDPEPNSRSNDNHGCQRDPVSQTPTQSRHAREIHSIDPGYQRGYQ